MTCIIGSASCICSGKSHSPQLMPWFHKNACTIEHQAFSDAQRQLSHSTGTIMLKWCLLIIHRARVLPALLCMHITDEHCSAVISIGCKCHYVNNGFWLRIWASGYCPRHPMWETHLGIPCISCLEWISEKQDNKGHHLGQSATCHGRHVLEHSGCTSAAPPMQSVCNLPKCV